MGNKVVLPKLTEDDVNKMIEKGRIVFYVGKKVIDATDYLGEHPAGEGCLRRRLGKDCEEDYEFHSKEGRKLWDKMCVGLKEN